MLTARFALPLLRGQNPYSLAVHVDSLSSSIVNGYLVGDSEKRARIPIFFRRTDGVQVVMVGGKTYEGGWRIDVKRLPPLFDDPNPFAVSP